MGIPRLNLWSIATEALAGYLQKAGGTMTGALTLFGAPTVDLHAATKKYVDDTLVFTGFSASKGSDQTGIPTVTATKITFTTEEYDVGGYYDAPNSRFTPPAGKYTINIVAAFSAGLTDQSGIRLYLYKNGSGHSVLYGVNASGTGTQGLNYTVDVVANGTDYFEAYAYAGGSGDKTVFAGARFQARKIG